MRSSDPEELALLHAVRLQGARIMEDLMRDLARMIVKEQADAEARGRKKKGKS